MRLCTICHRRISAARLKARPDARLCVSCKSQQDEELLHAGAPVVRAALVIPSEGDGEQLRGLVWGDQ